MFKRVLIKVSGEGLMGDKSFGMDPNVITNIAKQIKEIHSIGVQVCLVVGGGNIFRGAKEASKGIDRSVADQVGMLATVMNALYLQNALENLDLQVRVCSGLNIPDVCEKYMYRKAHNHLEKNRIVIFAAGTGNPYFTTDTGAALRASEMKCEALFKATQVDGVYDDDPKTNPNAKRYEKVSYQEVLSKNLKVMDLSAIDLAKQNNIPIVVFKQDEPNGFVNAVKGTGKQTIIGDV
ncbi:MAG: UMP kinase [Alphaproteobacteria bacterium]